MRFIKKYFFLVILLILAAAAIWYMQGRSTISTEGYSVDNVYDTIKELSSDKYKGRRYGTNENLEAVKYVEEQFKAIGLKPAGKDNTYFREYFVNASSYKGPAVLEVVDSEGKIVKEYKYGEDFKEQNYGYSAPGEVTSLCNSIVYNGEKTLDINATDDMKIAVVSNKAKDTESANGVFVALGRADFSALINVVDDETDFRKGSANLGNRLAYKTGYEIPTITAKDRVAEEIISYSKIGYRVHLMSAFDVVPATAKDVMGMIPGKSGNYLFVTAHLDHVGQGSDGTIYPGALDNASGVGSMIEIARFIKDQGITPSDNIVFIAFNGQEGGTLGSTGYVFNAIHPLYRTKVINLDMIGSKKNIPLTLLYSTGSSYAGRQQDPSSKMRYHLRKLAQSMGLSVDEKIDPSGDHRGFNSAGVPAVTLSHLDSENSHMPTDDIDNISKENIERGLKVAASYISMEAFSNMKAGGYSIVLEEIKDFVRCLYPLLLLMTAILLLLKTTYKQKDGDTRNIKIPVFSVSAVIIMMSVISYFSVNYPYAPSNSSMAFIGLIGRSLLSAGVSVLMIPMYLISMIPGFTSLFITDYRVRSWKYRGSGKEYIIVYYIAFIVTVIASLWIAVLYNKPAYYAVTPDFARSLAGVVSVYVCISAAAYFIYRLFCFESRIRKKDFWSLTAFCVIFFLLLSSFYIPISTNKYMINVNSGNISVGGSPN